MEIERIIERIYDISKRTHRNKLLPETLLEAMNNSKTIFNSDERQTAMFKEIIKTEKPNGIYVRLAKKYNVKNQRIIQIKDAMVEKMYLSDSKRRFEKLKTNDEKLNASINDLGLDNKTTDFLMELHCEKVKDIYNIDKNYLRDICATKNIDYKKLIRRLEILDIKNIKTNNHLKAIEEFNMPPCAYRYIKRNGICTNQEFIRNIDRLLENEKIRSSIKEKIKELYLRILEELDEIEINEDNNYDKKM